jgi:AcrR family transcriptional regulator
MTGQIDGRTARRERNRAEVVEAALQLVEEGVADPSVDELTERSGLSARSIFRYFEGLDDLRRAVLRRHFENCRAIIEELPAGDGSLEARIKAFADCRIRFNEAMAGPARTAQTRAPFSELIAADIQELRRTLEASTRRYFAPELKGRTKTETDDVLALIDVIVSFDSWERLVDDHGRSRAQVRRAWTRALESLLAS